MVIGEENGNQFQQSCLEKAMNREVFQIVVYGAANIQTTLK